MGNHYKRPREQSPNTISAAAFATLDYLNQAQIYSVVAYKRESKHDLIEVRKLLTRMTDLIDVTLEVSK
jgi:hypothetical protein